MALALAIAANSNLTYADALKNLQTNGGRLQGGNYDFRYDASLLNAGVLSCGGDPRCNGIHFSGGYVHLDTANPFTVLFGLFQHAFVDVFLGNVGYTVIPRPGP